MRLEHVWRVVAFVAVLVNGVLIFNALFHHDFSHYVDEGFAYALIVGMCARYGWHRSPWGWAIAGYFLGFIVLGFLFGNDELTPSDTDYHPASKRVTA